MKNLKSMVFCATLLAASGAQAIVIDFVDLAEASNGLGESAWGPLAITDGGFTTSITAKNTVTGDAAWAYLDYRHAGLGVCKKLIGQADAAVQGGAGDTDQGNTARAGKSSNICNPASDDNTTVSEELMFVFDQDVIINKIWLNNTHDPSPSGQILDPETVLVNGESTVVRGNGYAEGNAYNDQGNLNANESNFLGGYRVAANTIFSIGYGGDMGEEFYISGVDIELDGGGTNVPAPGTLILVGSAIFGLGLGRRRKHSH
jgi:hypothetical protein